MKKLFGTTVAMALLAVPTLSRATVLQKYWVDVSADAAGQTSPGSAKVAFWWDPTTTGPATYDLITTPVSIVSAGGVTEGMLNELDVTVDSDPAVKLNFNVSSSSSTTTFSITSPIINIAPLTNPQAFATSGLTLTDNTGDDTGTYTGGTLTGTIPGHAPASYEANYNNSSGAQDFADLGTNLNSSNPNHTTSMNYQFPAAGVTVIPGTVSDISSQFQFSLSALQSASGTSDFSVNKSITVPEPASVGLALLASSLGLMGRRRKI